ncbi:MAG TPA: pimeloyl-CoA dehydrogenase large subunit [Alphaproteobacteria bacterium]|nr:pimeloyl-CoA dehydrogenase large subunit [Alphaproteobacteria bacterium]HAJ46898.1 pimeloyl-CoA dehydrogenase large subunit [Alphaproteobacteria bacterium]
MDLSFSASDLQFRDEVRAFIAGKYDVEMRRKMALSKNGYLDKASMVKWQKALHERGWIAPNWPKEFGGAGFTATQKYIFDLEMSAAGTPIISPMGLKMVAPVIMAFGSAEQKKKFLPPILSTDVWWCQGYSEPGSGSDLASLQMRAEDKGDHYLCNGTKIWTTHAQWADWIFCLVRTKQGTKPQEGISFILIDMKTPGITVKPIITVDGPPADEQEVNQVFFDDVKVPKANLVGKENEGWTYAKYLLEFERGNAYAPGLKRALKKVRNIAAAERVDGQTLSEDPDFQRKIADIDVQLSAMEFTELRIFSGLAAGQRPGAESSMLKCRGTELQQAVTELVLEAVGHHALPFVENPWERVNTPFPAPDYAVPAAPYYFNARKGSIYAGSNEIQRNIMAKMVLGL